MSATGSFANWFARVYDALRCSTTSSEATSPSEDLSGASCDDVAAVEQLLLTLMKMRDEVRQNIRDSVLSSAKKRSEREEHASALPATATLSVVDVLDVLEHCQNNESSFFAACTPPASSSSSNAVHILEAFVAQEATKPEVRTLLSLLSCNGDSLAVLRNRLVELASRDRPQPQSPRAMSPPPPPERTHPNTKRPREVEEVVSRGAPSTREQAAGVPPSSKPKPPSAPSIPLPSSVGISTTLTQQLLWKPSGLDASLRLHLISTGTDPLPPGPLDPQHPQRVMESTPEKLIRRMMKDGTSTGFFADLKYDGERLIAFKTMTGYRFFSRNMLAVPDRKLDQVRELLGAAFGTHTVVIDAEILSMSTFGSMNEIHKREIAMSGPRIYVFDLLWINGHSLVSLPLESRREVLYAAMSPSKNVTLTKCYWIDKCSTGGGGGTMESKLQLVFDEAMCMRLEGYVLKPARSTYRFGGTDWVKLKKGYMIGDDGPALPGGLAAALASPKVRRIDGISITEVVQQHGAGGGGAGGGTRTALRCTLSDTVDCIVVGWRGDLALCCVLHTATRTYVPIGFATDPHRVTFISPTSIVAVSTSAIPFAVLPRGKDVALEYVVKDVSFCPVVEVKSGALVENTLFLSENQSPAMLDRDATVIRIRDDKDYRCVNTTDQVTIMFKYARPQYVMSEEDALATAVTKFNNQHWEALPPLRRGVTLDPLSGSSSGNIVSGGKTSCLQQAIALSKSKSKQVQAVLVSFAAQRLWCEKGLMGEVSKLLGDEPKQLCQTTLSASSASSGDVVATTVKNYPRLVCFIAAVMSLVKSSDAATTHAALDDAAVLDIVIVRIVGMLLALVPRCPDGVCLHIEVNRAAEEVIWRTAFDCVLKALPTDAQKGICVTLYQKRSSPGAS